MKQITYRIDMFLLPLNYVKLYNRKKKYRKPREREKKSNRSGDIICMYLTRITKKFNS